MATPSSPGETIDPSESSVVTPDNNNTNNDTFMSSPVKEPSENDVLCGRGGSINSHSGNERFRTLVEKRKRVYLTARFKREKRLIASSIVSEIRALDPPGRFLSRDSKTGLWVDIGDDKARDKTSQALRENAPSIRAEIETEINEQRAEMQREEEVARAAQPPPPPYYNNPGWGGYHSYYGYSHHAPPPPPPPGYPPYEGHWGAHPPPPPHYYPQHPPHHPPHAPKSAIEQTADIVSSGAESLKNWAESSLSGIVGSTSSHDGRDARSVQSANSKPIVYVHEARKRRMVKFREPKRSRKCYSPINAGDNSLVDGQHDIEPQQLHEPTDEHSTSMVAQFANQVMDSIGSWDAATAICGDAHVDDRVPFPEAPSSSKQPAEPEEEMAVEWEGQEVQLLDRGDQSSVASEDRMPPPVVRKPVAPVANDSVAFSSLGSCHSWLPEQFGSAASFFSSSRNGAVASAASMEMEYSAAGTENYSMAGTENDSIGGGSLTRVFENEAHEYPKDLNQMPSWERSLRSKSPLSIGSDNDDDESLVSKSSSKAMSPRTVPNNDMVWESKE